jgi:hypothetical protein
MRVFAFISGRDRDVLGFTAHQDGANLPSGYAPWNPAAAGGAVLLGDDADHASDANIVFDGIRRDGYFLAVGGYEDDAPINPARH